MIYKLAFYSGEAPNLPSHIKVIRAAHQAGGTPVVLFVVYIPLRKFLPGQMYHKS